MKRAAAAAAAILGLAAPPAGAAPESGLSGLSGVSEAGGGSAAGEASSGSAAGEAPPWSVEVRGELALAPGEVAATEVVLRGRGRHRVAASGLRLELTTSGPGISVRQRRYLRADGVGADNGERAEAVFSIPVRGEAVGSYDLEVRARFWACTPRSCRPVDERRRVAVTVSAPAPAATPADEKADEKAAEAGPAPARPARSAPPAKPATRKTPAAKKAAPAKPFR